MLQNLINRFECLQAMQVNKNFNSQELTVLGKILLEGAREVEVANVIRFPSIERGFSIFSIETGNALATSAADGKSENQMAHAESVLPKMTSGLITDLKNDAYHLIVRQGSSLEHGMVLASFTNMQSAALGLRKLARLNARKSRFWKITGALVVAYLLLSIPFIKRPPTKGLSEISSSFESRNPEIARQMENINRSRTVGSELMAEQPGSAATGLAQPDPTTMLGGQSGLTESAPAATSIAKPEQNQGNFGF